MPKRKPAMPAVQRERARAAKAKMRDAWTAPGFAFGGVPGEFSFQCPFRDQDKEHWWWLVAEALGSRNQSVILYSLDQLTALCSQRWSDQGWEPEPRELNTALAICATGQPENEMQAALVMQMVALHFSAMKLGGNIGRCNGVDERTAATLARVTKAYASLARSLLELQGRTHARTHRQLIEVCYVDARTQTVVMGEGGDFGGQVHGANNANGGAAIIEGRPALPCPQSGGAPVWLSGGEGKEGVPLTWWWQRLRRAIRRS